jgi:hypothetical protein
MVSKGKLGRVVVAVSLKAESVKLALDLHT